MAVERLICKKSNQRNSIPFFMSKHWNFISVGNNLREFTSYKIKELAAPFEQNDETVSVIFCGLHLGIQLIYI